jgi:hypothetical protein
MKKLLLIALAAAAAYGAWKYLEKVQQTAAQNQGRLKSPSEKALKDMDKDKYDATDPNRLQQESVRIRKTCHCA